MPHKEALAKATAALAGPEDHCRDQVDRRNAPAARKEEQDCYEGNDFAMDPNHVGNWWQADGLGNSWQESSYQSRWKEEDGGRTRALAAIVGDRNLEIAEAERTQYAFQQSMMAEKTKFQQTVTGMLGKLWEEAQRAPSTLAGTGATSTPKQD